MVRDRLFDARLASLRFVCRLTKYAAPALYQAAGEAQSRMHGRRRSR